MPVQTLILMYSPLPTGALMRSNPVKSFVSTVEFLQLIKSTHKCYQSVFTQALIHHSLE